MEWYLKVIRDNYANFEGRARRTEYWMFTLIHIIIIFALAFMSGFLADTGLEMLPLIVIGIYFLATFIPTLAVTVRRLHDTGKSGWYYLMSFIPYVGGIIMLVFCATEGNRGPNQYGADPKMPEFEIDEIGKPLD